MKPAGWVLLVVSIVMFLSHVGSCCIADYQWERDIGSYWSLADKSSTIDEKGKQVDLFIKALESSGCSGSGALFFQTPNNSWEKNLDAIKTLQRRLSEIKTMNVSSFEYQTAMQQITAQEQGEAQHLISAIKAVWLRQNWYINWEPIAIIFGVFYSVFGCVGFYFLCGAYNIL